MYQKEYDTLYKSMVPASGSALTLNGELIRAVSRLAYEYLNNGNCNACECREVQNDYWGGDEDDEDFCCEEEYESTVSEFYGKFINLIKETIDNNTVKALCNGVEDIIENSCNEGYRRVLFCSENRAVYDNLVDEVVYYVLTNEDKQLPESYIKG